MGEGFYDENLSKEAVVVTKVYDWTNNPYFNIVKDCEISILTRGEKAYDVYTYMSFGWQIGLAYGSEIVLALINLLVFIYGCKHRLSFRQNMHQKRRKAQFKAQFSEPRPGSGISRHKCYICGRTELSNPELTFRYCSKCTGNKEYCQDHLFTHTHV
jgi:hypothetical protein